MSVKEKFWWQSFSMTHEHFPLKAFVTHRKSQFLFNANIEHDGLESFCYLWGNCDYTLIKYSRIFHSFQWFWKRKYIAHNCCCRRNFIQQIWCVCSEKHDVEINATFCLWKLFFLGPEDVKFSSLLLQTRPSYIFKQNGKLLPKKKSLMTFTHKILMWRDKKY